MWTTFWTALVSGALFVGVWIARPRGTSVTVELTGGFLGIAGTALILGAGALTLTSPTPNACDGSILEIWLSQLGSMTAAYMCLYGAGLLVQGAEDMRARGEGEEGVLENLLKPPPDRRPPPPAEV